MATRVDALGEDTEASIGINARATVEARLRQLEGKTLGDASGVTKMKNENKKLDKDREGAVIAAKKAYNPDKDVVVEEKREKRVRKRRKRRRTRRVRGNETTRVAMKRRAKNPRVLTTTNTMRVRKDGLRVEEIL